MDRFLRGTTQDEKIKFYYAFGKELAVLHGGVFRNPLAAKIVHRDLSPQNIFIQEKSNNYIFSLIDWETSEKSGWRDTDLLGFLCHLFRKVVDTVDDYSAQLSLMHVFLRGYCEAVGERAVLTYDGFAECKELMRFRYLETPQYKNIKERFIIIEGSLIPYFSSMGSYFELGKPHFSRKTCGRVKTDILR
jgi:tRNA A-37 threonylcarbamoyl transferase component Bud32